MTVLAEPSVPVKVPLTVCEAVEVMKSLPELPTMNETIPGFELVTWQGVVTAAGTPRELLARINREFNAVLEQPEIRQRLTDTGLEVAGGHRIIEIGCVELLHRRPGPPGRPPIPRSLERPLRPMRPRSAWNRPDRIGFGLERSMRRSAPCAG